MKRAITVAFACTVAVVLPAASGIASNGNGHSKSLAAKQCAALKKADRGAFRAMFGKHAMRDCIRDAASELEDEKVNAAQQCRADRDLDPEGFQELWGTNEPQGEKSHGTNKNAFGKCVSARVRDEVDDEVDDFDNAARQCRADRDLDPEGFRELWGTNEPKGEKSKGTNKNAFGKCVSATAKAADEDGGEPTA
jgi:hypothetical protein